jgi:hypothetical protein
MVSPKSVIELFDSRTTTTAATTTTKHLVGLLHRPPFTNPVRKVFLPKNISLSSLFPRSLSYKTVYLSTWLAISRPTQ